MKMMNDTTWNCPVCGEKNVDNFEETVTPRCGGCGIDVLWEEILAHEQLILANLELRELHPDPQCQCITCKVVTV